jgi:hypothetical protein
MNSSVTKHKRKGLPLNAWVRVSVQVRYTDCPQCLYICPTLAFVINPYPTNVENRVSS